MQILSIRNEKELTEEPSALGGLGTSIRRKWKEECMNHGRGERTDHLPIFDPTKKLCQKNRMSRLTGTKAISINQSTLIEETVT